MPIYEYACQKCQQISEIFQKISDPHPEQCPKCSEQQSLRKIISQTSFALKGDGWYVTDYKATSGGAGKGTGVAESDKVAEASASKSTEGNEAKTNGSPLAETSVNKVEASSVSDSGAKV